MYKYLELLSNQVLYFHTDSIIYLWREGLPDVETAPFLGQMKDETAGVPIHEFVTGGAKNYSHMLQNSDTDCKIRGFTLDEQGRALLNFETMKRHISDEIKDPKEDARTIAVPVSINFETNRSIKKICLTPKVKKYGLVLDKRVTKTEDFTSRPYGYEWIGETLEL